MLGLRQRLRARGVVGINRRNAWYLGPANPRRHYPLVDDKLRTKELAMAAGMAVPELYGVISTQHDIRELPRLVGDREEFVVKPARGSGGNGILVIAGRRGRLFCKSSGQLIGPSELAHHASNALSGLYSLAGQRDRVLVEYCVRTHPLFQRVTFQGVPDVRVLVFRGYPVMGMIRLPTRISDGKANLHQGAVGVGVDLATGTTLGGVLGNVRIEEHPDTGYPIAGLGIPAWDGILELAARCHGLTGLGYLGVDIVLDAELGPLILELNARPGLNIQIANREGLEGRLQTVEREGEEGASLGERLTFVRERFARGSGDRGG